jgi:hypothetical protein
MTGDPVWHPRIRSRKDLDLGAVIVPCDVESGRWPGSRRALVQAKCRLPNARSIREPAESWITPGVGRCVVRSEFSAARAGFVRFSQARDDERRIFLEAER